MEQDCRKKLILINVLFLACLAVVGFCYYRDLVIEINLYNLLK